ncbi:TonB-dependent siderophore receptor, partial [Steroidobacter sp.]|uniref:TonB-dependent siderophore receptor n=1 Tax=Steroidobacter sp. TaxID=1978227 RepID=UPI001A4E5CF2
MSVISGSWLRARTIAVILGAALAATGVPADAQAQTATTTYQLEIPSQSLHDALQALALASRHRMFYQADIVNGKVNAAISGKYTTEEAVRAMLAGTNLEYEISADGVVIVRARGSASSKTSWTGGTGSLHLAQAATSSESDKTYLDEVVVKGTTIDDPILSSRTGDTVRDRPRAVTIVTRERLDEQNINTVNSVLDQSTGVTVARVNFANQRYYARGFQIGSLQVDGAAPIPTDGSGSGFLNIADLSMYEQVEVMRGPDALFSGNGASGGSLQLVRKRPTKNTQMSLALLAGSWSQYRAEIDASGPLGWDGRLRGRVVYAKEDSDSYLSNGE